MRALLQRFGQREALLALGCIVSSLVFSFLSPYFATPDNLLTIARNSSAQRPCRGGCRSNVSVHRRSARRREEERDAQREKRSVRSTGMQLSLAFLAPSLVEAIADNRLPRGIGLTRLADLPSDWSDQFKTLGVRAPR
jgi:hypothetical protein